MPEKSVTPGQILEWGKQVANGLLNDGISLFDGTKKIAMDNGLNEHQINRVAEASNQSVFKSAFHTNPNKLFEFPVVKGEEVIQALSMPTTKTASIDDSDYSQPPPTVKLAMDYDEVFDRIFPKTASEKPSLRQEYEEKEEISKLRIEFNKVSAMEGDIRSMAVGSDMRREDKEDEFYHQVRQMLLEGKSFEEVYENLMLDHAGMDGETASQVEIKSLIERIMDRLKAENLIDSAEEVPDDTPKMQVLNRSMAPDYKVASMTLTEIVKEATNYRTYRFALEDLQKDIKDKHAAYMAAYRRDE